MNEKANSLLELIRMRPGMYLGSDSLTALWHFIHGYEFALEVHGLNENPFNIPRSFHDWVAYKLNFLESTSSVKKSGCKVVFVE